MIVPILLLAVIVYFSWKAAPREKAEDSHVHGAGQVGLLAALALFGVDYFTSYYYASGEMLHALHPYGLQNYAYIAVFVIALANVVFGALYMLSLGVFREGGGSFAASMRYLGPSISLVVAVVLVQDYVFTIVVSTLSGSDQLLSVLGQYNINWFWHFAIGALLASFTWFVTIRGRGESARLVFTLLGVFLMLTVIMFGGLFAADIEGVQPAEALVENHETPTLGEALYHLLTASMKGLVALSGLEAMSDGIQFVINDDAGLVKWGRKRLPKLKKLWDFYGGKSGIGRLVQTSFLFYGGLTTLFLTFYALRFNVFDGTHGRTLVGNLAFIGFGQIPSGEILFWAYQFLAVALLAAASMTAYQDLQAISWRNVAIGEIPEIVVYRNPQRHVHPPGHSSLYRRDHCPIPGAGQNERRGALLRRWRLLANYRHGLSDPPAYPAQFHRQSAAVGQPGRRIGRRYGRAHLHRADRRQMERRRLDGADCTHRAGVDSPCDLALALRLSRQQGYQPHHPRQIAR